MRGWSSCAHGARICVPCAKERQHGWNRKSYRKHRDARRAAIVANRSRRKVEDPQGLSAMERASSKKWRVANPSTLKARVLRYHAKPANKLRALRTQARNRGLACTLTIDEYAALVGPNRCAYCEGTLSTYGSGLDRLDNGRDYEAGNVVPCCADCNDVRSDRFSPEEMLVIGKAIRAVHENRLSAARAVA